MAAGVASSPVCRNIITNIPKAHHTQATLDKWAKWRHDHPNWKPKSIPETLAALTACEPIGTEDVYLDMPIAEDMLDVPIEFPVTGTTLPAAPSLDTVIATSQTSWHGGSTGFGPYLFTSTSPTGTPTLFNAPSSVPEPATWSLAIMGIVVLIRAGRRI